MNQNERAFTVFSLKHDLGQPVIRKMAHLQQGLMRFFTLQTAAARLSIPSGSRDPTQFPSQLGHGCFSDVGGGAD
jgi:hypothetical protein